MLKFADGLLQPPLPAPAGGPMSPGVTPKPPPAPSLSQPWNFGTYGLPNLSNPSQWGGLAAAGKSLLSPPKPQAAMGSPAPAGPVGAATGAGGRAIGQQAGGLVNHMFSSVSSVGNPLSGAMASLSAPPLTHLTSGLGSFKGIADRGLNFIQDNIKGPDGAQRFASGVAMLGGGLTKGLMETPFAAPALAGLYGALGGRGVQGAADAAMLARPLAGKLGLKI